MKKETQTGAVLSQGAKLIEENPIASPDTARAGAASARRTMAVQDLAATLPIGQQSLANLIGADAKAERPLAEVVAILSMHRRVECDAGSAPR